jgi:outer membrane protein assembly factor BamB
MIRASWKLAAPALTFASMQKSAIALAVALAACVAPVRADNWPAFRGADGRSVSRETGFPVEWAPGRNVRWRVELPGRSNGSPIVWGDKVFVAQPQEGSRRTLICFGRADGKLLWQSGITYADKEPTHPDNPYCSGSPAADGERVVVAFGSAGLYCYDLAGKELWHRELGKLEHMFGNAISPVIAGDLVVVNFGPGPTARLVAVDKRTGEIAWEAQPPKVDPNEQRLTGTRLAAPAAMFANPFVSQGDKNDDAALSREEMTAMAEKWYAQLDAEKTGKVSKEQFCRRLKEIVPPMGGGGPDIGTTVAPPMFAAIDADKDGSVTREELKDAFSNWFDKWGGGRGEPLDANQVLDGLSAIAPAPKGAASPFGNIAGPGGSWSTPILVHAGDRDELVVSFPNRLAGYEPKTGKLLWFSRDLKDSAQPMPMFADGLVVAHSGDMAGGSTVAVRPGGSGDVTDSCRAWKQPRVKGSIGTGVVHDGRVYNIASEGFLLCTDLKTGKQLWQKRLEPAGDKGESWSSILLADGKLYIPNKSGDVFVVRAGPKFELLATNSVNEPTNTSLAASDGQLFLRTDKALWCIGGN